MADLTIESLSIEISAEAQSAINTTKRLTEKLRQLKQATSGGLAGAAEFAKGMREIASAARSLNNVDDTKLKNTAEALKALSSLRNVGDLTNTAAQMKNLKKITESINSMPLIGQDKLQNIRDISTALSSLSSIPAMPDLSGVARSVSQLTAAAAAIQQTNMGDFSHKIKDLAKALQPLTTLGKTNLSSFINSLRRLPEITAALSSMDMGAFAAQIQRVSTAIAPLITQFNTLSTSLNSLPQPLQRAVAGLMNYNTGAQQAGNTTNNLLGKIKNLLNIGAIYATLRRLKSVLGGMVESSNAYVENLNLFTVSMGNAADDALNFANRVNQLMGIDVSQWIENQGYFKQIASGFGVVEDKANLMSQNLTQLGYDISSFYNISVESAMQKLQSGISGEIMPLRSLGYALDEATLKQVAYNHGITESLTNMSQAQKSQIRYLAIMEQSKNALGDMARTIESPANQLRIFSQRVDQLKRAIGNGLMPIISAALPYVTALVRMLTEGAQKIADFLGFEIPVFDYGDLIAAQNADISSSFDEATSAAREFQGSLSSIDQLNIIGDKAKSSAADGLGGLYDLNVDLPTYDFLGGLSEQADDAYNKLKNIVNEALPWVEALAGAFIGFKIGQGIFKIPIAIAQVTTALSKLPPWITRVFSKLAPLGIAVGAAVSSFVLLKSSVKGLMTDTGSLTGNLLKLGAGVGIATAAIAGLALTGHPALAVIVGITAALGAAIGAIEATVEEMKAFDDELNNSITYAENGGISLTGLTDGFKDYVKAITDHYNDILTNTSAFKDNQEKINGAVVEVKNLVDKYNLLGQTMTSEDAQSIADNVKIIGDGISENLGVGTQGIVDSLKDHFHEFALQLGADVDDMVTKFYLLEGMGNTVLAATRKKADEIVLKLQAGDLSADEQRQALEELQNTVNAMGTTDIGTQEEMNFARALQQMTSAKINLEDPTKAMENITSLNEMADAARTSITTAYNEQSYQLAQMKRQYETMTDLSSGKTVKEMFDEQMGAGAFDTLFSETQKIYDKAKKTNIARIDTGVVAYVSMLQSQLDENAKRYANTKLGEVGPGFGTIVGEYIDYYKTGGPYNLKNLTGVTPSQVTNQARKDYEEEYKNLNSELQTTLDSALSGLNVTPEAVEVGRQLVSGVALGTEQNTDYLTNAINTAAESMIKEFNDTCEIRSPSRVFARSGGYIMKGLANGLTDGQRYALQAIDETARAMQRQMSDFYFEVPEYTSEDFEKIMLGDFSIAPSSLPTPPTTESYDERTVSEMASIFAAAKQNGEPIVLHNYTTVELDGQVLGEAQSTYQNDQMVYSNGVTR